MKFQPMAEATMTSEYSTFTFTVVNMLVLSSELPFCLLCTFVILQLELKLKSFKHCECLLCFVTDSGYVRTKLDPLFLRMIICRLFNRP